MWISDLDCAVDISMDVSESFKLNCQITRCHQHAPKDKATEENVAQGNEEVGLDPLIRSENKYRKWIRYDTKR